MLDDLEIIDGFHQVERDGLGAFCWTQGVFRVRLRRTAPYLKLHLCYYGDDGVMQVRGQCGHVDRIELCRGWHHAIARLSDSAAGSIVELSLRPLVTVPDDSRELGIMLRAAKLSDDGASFERWRTIQQNLKRNQRECSGGLETLSSTPPAIRINLEARCNIPETSQACAYCAWDWAKESEHGSPGFTLDTLDELGDFYRQAVEVNDCSIGEPTMNKDFGQIVVQIDRDDKQISLTTNGQLLTPRIRRELVGKNVLLYVSLDSATATGYARYRNDRFDDVVSNVAALCREKVSHGNLPRVYISFIAMRSNLHELPEFFRLVRELGADEIKLRSLYLDENVDPVATNGAYNFDYADEVLSLDELDEAARQAHRLSEQHGIAVHVEWENFARDVCDGPAQLCNEPWRTLYILRRGIMPCCYATEPIARWSERQGRPLETFLHEVFNGAKLREIRRELAAGQLSDYCRNTPSCPILKERLQAGLEVGEQNAFQRRALSTANADPDILPYVPLTALAYRSRAA